MNIFATLKEFEDQLTETQLDSIMDLVMTENCNVNFQFLIIELLHRIGLDLKIGQALLASKLIIEANVG
jgi:hypothetical protein